MSSTNRRRLTRHSLLRAGATIARPVRSAVVLMMLAPLPLFAQRPDMFDPDFSKAVSAIFTFDHFAGLCAEGKGLSPQDAAEVGTWRVTNKIDLVRARVAELEPDATQNARLNQARAEVRKKYGTLKLWSCRAALQSTRRPEARLAANAPQLLDALERNGAVASTTDAATSAPAQQSAVDRASSVPQVQRPARQRRQRRRPLRCQRDRPPRCSSPSRLLVSTHAPPLGWADSSRSRSTRSSSSRTAMS